MAQVLPGDETQYKIYLIRNVQVMVDSDLAQLYEVETKTLKRAIRRNIERFPADFMFELTKAECETLRCQIGTSKVENVDNPLKKKGSLICQIGTSKVENVTESSETRGGDRSAHFVFTEPGVSMLSSVLRSNKAIQINIAIMRAFIQIRKQRDSQTELLQNFWHLERRFDEFSDRVERLESKSRGRGESVLGTWGNDQAEILSCAQPVEVFNQGVTTKIQQIQNEVFKYSGYRVNDFKSKARARDLVFARQIAIYLIREHLSVSFREIGKHFNGRDHSTVLHSYNKIKLELKRNNKGVQEVVASMEKALQKMNVGMNGGD